jgi:hypothetical protein
MRQEAAMLPGAEYHLTAPPLLSKAFSALASALILVYLVALAIRYGRNPLRGQRYLARAGNPHWVDAAAKANKLKWSLRLRALMRVLSMIAAASILVTRQVPVSSVLYLGITAWFGWIRPIGKSLRDWHPRRVRGTFFRHNRQAWLELIVGAASLGCIIVSVFLCLVDVFVYALDLAQSPLVVDGVLDPRYLTALPAWLEVFVTLLVAIPVSDLFQVTSIAVIILLAVAALLRRFGRRFAVADALAAQARDPRPPVIYLRNFADDALKMPSSSLARTSITERLSVVRLQPFEEILVRHLGRFGPVVALSHPDARLPVLGAARMVRSNEDWKDQIRQWARRAGMVVVAAAPRAMSPGLTWEIEFLATEGASVPVLLVVSPYRRGEIEGRWARFCAEATRWPRFWGLAPFAEDNSGAHFLAERPGKGWGAWGAAKRSEYTYAVSLAEATRAVMGEQAVSAGKAPRRGRWAPGRLPPRLGEADSGM